MTSLPFEEGSNIRFYVVVLKSMTRGDGGQKYFLMCDDQYTFKGYAFGDLGLPWLSIFNTI